MKKGFTVIETLVVIAIAGIVISIIIAAISNERKPNESEQEYCARKGDLTLDSIPAKCLKYYQTNSTTKL